MQADGSVRLSGFRHSLSMTLHGQRRQSVHDFPDFYVHSLNWASRELLEQVFAAALSWFADSCLFFCCLSFFILVCERVLVRCCHSLILHSGIKAALLVTLNSTNAIYISHGSVARHLQCDKIFNGNIITDLLLSLNTVFGKHLARLWAGI